MNDIHTLDLVLFGVMLLSVIVAYLRGFVRETFALASWAGALVAAYFGLDPAAELLSQWLQPELVAQIVAAAGAFILTLVVLSIIAGRLSALVGRVGLALDRALGFLFGLLRGAVVICFVYLVFTRLVPVAEQPGWVREARSLPMVTAGAEMIERLLPGDLADLGDAAAERTRREMERLEETRLLYRKLENPRPAASDDAPDAAPGYKDSDRRSLDRLIRGTGQGERP